MNSSGQKNKIKLWVAQSIKFGGIRDRDRDRDGLKSSQIPNSLLSSNI